MKKLKVSLLATGCAFAIAAGVVFGQFLARRGSPASLLHLILCSATSCQFSIPLIILGLVTPAIGELGQRGRQSAGLDRTDRIWLNYLSLVSSPISAVQAIFPHILPVNTELTAMENPRRLHVATLVYSRHCHL